MELQIISLEVLLRKVTKESQTKEMEETVSIFLSSLKFVFGSIDIQKPSHVCA